MFWLGFSTEEAPQTKWVPADLSVTQTEAVSFYLFWHISRLWLTVRIITTLTFPLCCQNTVKHKTSAREPRCFINTRSYFLFQFLILTETFLRCVWVKMNTAGGQRGIWEKHECVRLFSRDQERNLFRAASCFSTSWRNNHLALSGHVKLTFTPCVCFSFHHVHSELLF